MSPKVVIITGPTGSGKTTLALRLAQGQSTSIIAADSRQVYRGLDVTTGKDIPAGFHREKDYSTDGTTRLFGLDLILPDQTLNAAEFSDYARAIIDQETKSGRQVIVVGGTGFYLKALTQPASLAAIPPDEKLRRELNPLSLEELRRRLQKVAPTRLIALNRSDAANPRRLIRAIEVALSPVQESPRRVGGVDFVWISLRLPLAELKTRIAQRVSVRLAAGALAEVEKLRHNYPDQTLPIYTSLGIKPLLAFLNGKITKEKLIDLWTAEEFHYAKRQLTWLKKQPGIIWYDGDAAKALTLADLL